MLNIAPTRAARKFDSAPCRHFGSKPFARAGRRGAFLDNRFLTLAREAIPQPEEPAEVVSADKGSFSDAYAGSALDKLLLFFPILCLVPTWCGLSWGNYPSRSWSPGIFSMLLALCSVLLFLTLLERIGLLDLPSTLSL